MIPADFFSHKDAWRNAITTLIAHASTEECDRSYWQHELRAFDRAYSEISDDTVDLYGVKADGTHEFLGKIMTPVVGKARELAEEMFGRWEPESCDEGELCFEAMQQLMEYMVRVGWKPPGSAPGKCPTPPGYTRPVEPEAFDGHDYEGFPGGCDRMGCSPEASAVPTDPERFQGRRSSPAWD